MKFINIKTGQFEDVTLDNKDDFFKNGYAIHKTEKGYFVFNANMERATEEIFEYIEAFDGRFFRAVKNDKYKLLNEDFETICSYPFIGVFSNGYAVVQNEAKKYGFINRDAKQVLFNGKCFIFDSLKPFGNKTIGWIGRESFRVTSDFKLLNNDGIEQNISEEIFESEDNMDITKSNGDSMQHNVFYKQKVKINNKIIKNNDEFDKYFLENAHEGFVVFEDENGFNWVNKNYEILTNKRYKFADNFYNGIAIFRDENGENFINKNGEELSKKRYHGVIIPTIYSNIITDIGYIIIDEGVTWADIHGKIITNKRYKDVGYFQDGFASFIDKKGKSGYCDKNGNEYRNDAFLFNDSDAFSSNEKDYAILREMQKNNYLRKDISEEIFESEDNMEKHVSEERSEEWRKKRELERRRNRFEKYKVELPPKTTMSKLIAEVLRGEFEPAKNDKYIQSIITDLSLGEKNPTNLIQDLKDYLKSNYIHEYVGEEVIEEEIEDTMDIDKYKEEFLNFLFKMDKYTTITSFVKEIESNERAKQFIQILKNSKESRFYNETLELFWKQEGTELFKLYMEEYHRFTMSEEKLTKSDIKKINALDVEYEKRTREERKPEVDVSMEQFISFIEKLKEKKEELSTELKDILNSATITANILSKRLRDNKKLSKSLEEILVDSKDDFEKIISLVKQCGYLETEHAYYKYINEYFKDVTEPMKLLLEHFITNIEGTKESQKKIYRMAINEVKDYYTFGYRSKDVRAEVLDQVKQVFELIYDRRSEIGNKTMTIMAENLMKDCPEIIKNLDTAIKVIEKVLTEKESLEKQISEEVMKIKVEVFEPSKRFYANRKKEISDVKDTKKKLKEGVEPISENVKQTVLNIVAEVKRQINMFMSIFNESNGKIAVLFAKSGVETIAIESKIKSIEHKINNFVLNLK